MNFLLDLFTNWTFDKVLDYMFAFAILRSLSIRVLLPITIHPYMFS
ncbi:MULTISPECIES: hypothetical protein [Bacillus]|nr:hypothetical protein [Bacillus spizizenii]MCI4166523.1 hypothetical protein [Bacillus spizizenii]MEC1436939.1 hypothetical protein [Bacillus spizizenii]